MYMLTPVVRSIVEVVIPVIMAMKEGIIIALNFSAPTPPSCKIHSPASNLPVRLSFGACLNDRQCKLCGLTAIYGRPAHQLPDAGKGQL